MQKKDTPTRRKGSTQISHLAHARRVLDVTPTKGDQDVARQLLAIYDNKQTPELFKHLLFQVFWDAMVTLYKIQLPKNFTRHWKLYWPLLVAKLRVQAYLPTRINYTWQPTEEEEVELDADDAVQAQADALFDARTIDPIGETLNELVNQTGCNVLDQREIFRVAWPLMLDALQKMNAPEGNGQ